MRSGRYGALAKRWLALLLALCLMAGMAGAGAEEDVIRLLPEGAKKLAGGKTVDIRSPNSAEDVADIWVKFRDTWMSDWEFDMWVIGQYGFLDLEGDGFPEMFVSFDERGTSYNTFYRYDDQADCVVEIGTTDPIALSTDLNKDIVIYREPTSGQLYYICLDTFGMHEAGRSVIANLLLLDESNNLVSRQLWDEEVRWEARSYEETEHEYNYTEYENIRASDAVGESNIVDRETWEQYQLDFLSKLERTTAHITTIDTEYNTASDDDLRDALISMFDAFYNGDWIKDYIQQHLDYYLDGFSTDVIPMEDWPGLSALLNEKNWDVSDALYRMLSSGDWLVSNLTGALDISQYVDWRDGDYRFELVDSYRALSSDGYSALLFQLLGNENTYEGLIETTEWTFGEKYVEVCEELLDNFDDVDNSALEASVVTLKDALAGQLKALRSAPSPKSQEFSSAQAQISVTLAGKGVLQSLKERVLQSIDGKDVILAGVGEFIDEAQTVQELIMRATWYKTYEQTYSSFRTVLDDVAHMAEIRAYSLTNKRFLGELDYLNTYSEASMCLGLADAIRTFLANMDAYSRNMPYSALREASNAMLMNGLDATGQIFLRPISELMWSYLCPPLLVTNKVLGLGKLAVDIVTVIDDESAQALLVESARILSTLLLEDAKNRGANLIIYEPLIQGRTYTNEQLALCFEDASLFHECVNMYKNTLRLACEYGTQYEQSKIDNLISAAFDNPNLRNTLRFVSEAVISPGLAAADVLTDKAELKQHNDIIDALAKDDESIGSIQCHIE